MAVTITRNISSDNVSQFIYSGGIPTYLVWHVQYWDNVSATFKTIPSPVSNYLLAATSNGTPYTF